LNKNQGPSFLRRASRRLSFSSYFVVFRGNLVEARCFILACSPQAWGRRRVPSPSGLS